MENVLAILFIVAMVSISLISKLREQKKAAEKQQERKRVTAQDLPPATRRAIYGSSDVPVARERGAAPQSERARQLARLEETAKGPAAVPERVPAAFEPRVARPAQPIQVRPVSAQPVQPPPVRPQPVAPGPTTFRQRAQTIREQIGKALEDAIEQATAQQQAPPPTPRRPQPRRAKAPPPRPAAPGGRREPARRPAVPSPARRAEAAPHVLFSDLGGIRRGIVLSEILGPPKALR